MESPRAFRNVSKTPDEEEGDDDESRAEFLPLPTYAVSCDLIPHAIQKQRNNKAPGKDGIPAEVYNSTLDNDTLEPWLHEILERAWRDEEGDKTRSENYRGISIIDVPAKIFAIVLLRRFLTLRDSGPRPNQAGFYAGRGYADQIFTLRRILEFCHSCQQPTAVCFIDFAATFDSVHRASLWRIMALDGVPTKIVAMIKAYYCTTNARVLGCILSPILFNYAIDWIIGRVLHEGDGVKFAPGHRLTDLVYVDDIALLASRFGDLQSMVSRVNEPTKSVGLSINAGKTKVFSSCIPDQEKAPLGTDGCHFEEADSFKYLEVRLLSNGQSNDDSFSRIDAARWVFFSLGKGLWIRRDPSIATKIRVYRVSVRSVLLYGCECLAFRVEDDRKLGVFDHHFLRTILQVKFTDFASNETVRDRCANIGRSFWHITDPHIDSNYSCQGALGNYECDSPLTLWISALNNTRRLRQQPPDFVIFSGDSVAHDERLSRAEFLDVMRSAAQRLRMIFPDNQIPIIPVLGNHDVHPANVLEVGESAAQERLEWCGRLATDGELWADWIALGQPDPAPNATRNSSEVFTTGCFFSRRGDGPGNVLRVTLLGLKVCKRL
ncbi:hypothetical protein SprV_0802477500 [Sparganum proliferum]